MVKLEAFYEVFSCFLFTFQNAARKRKFSVIVAEGAPFYKVCRPVPRALIADFSRFKTVELLQFPS